MLGANAVILAAHFRDVADCIAACKFFLRIGRPIFRRRGSFDFDALHFLVVACTCLLELIFELLVSRLLGLGMQFSDATAATIKAGARRRPRDSSSSCGFTNSGSRCWSCPE